MNVLMGSRELIKEGKIALMPEIDSYMKAKEEEGKTAFFDKP